MKPLVFLALTIMLISSLAGMSFAGMYWTGETDRSTSITDADFDAKVPGTNPSTRRFKMYDDYQPPTLSNEPEAEEGDASALSPIRRRSTRRTEGATRNTRATTGPRRPEITRPEPAQSITDKPRAVTGTPGTSPGTLNGPIQSVIGTPATSTPATTGIEEKKMPWGKVEVKSAEPKTGKFKWGEPIGCLFLV